MKIIPASFTVLYPTTRAEGIAMVRAIEAAARTCYQSGEKITDDSYLKFVQGIIKRQHDAMLEFADISVRLIVDRGLMAELTRHRLVSFAVESTRYVRYEDGLTVICPPEIDPARSTQAEKAYDTWHTAMTLCEAAYRYLLNIGVQPQIARSVLPLCLATELVMKANIREWRHIFTLRTSKAAHPQMRSIMLELLRTLQELVPVVFDDIGGESE